MTSDELLDGLKSRAIIPSSQALYSDANILTMADDVIAVMLVPLLTSLRQDYFVTTSTQVTVASQNGYKIPYRSIGRTLRDLKLYKTSTPASKIDLTRIASEDEHLYLGTGSPFGFYFKQDKYVLVPTPTDTSYTLEEWYMIQPSRLVQVSQAAKVVSFTSTMVTCDAIPAEIVTNSVIDFIDGYPGHTIRSMDKTVTAISGNTLTFASGVIPSDLAVDDYIALKQKTPFITLPEECYRLLESELAHRILTAQGDFEGAKNLDATIMKETENLKKVLEPRVKGEATKMINRRSLLRSGKVMYKRGLFY